MERWLEGRCGGHGVTKHLHGEAAGRHGVRAGGITAMEARMQIGHIMHYSSWLGIPDSPCNDPLCRPDPRCLMLVPPLVKHLVGPGSHPLSQEVPVHPAALTILQMLKIERAENSPFANCTSGNDAWGT